MSRKKLPSYPAPFSKGNLQHWIASNFGTVNGGIHDEWRDNVPFEATLTIDSMRSGYSAKYTIWKDEHGHTYPMFVADIVDLVRDSVIQNGTVKGKWIVRKRGQNYGVKFYEE